MTQIPATRHVAYGYDDLAYEGSDPKRPDYFDDLTDRAEDER